MILEALAAVITTALASWMGEKQGLAVGRLGTTVAAAHAQIEVAQGLLRNAAEPGVTPEQAAQLIQTARGIIDGTRADVLREAFNAATVVPAAVLDAFTNFGAAADAAAKRLASAAGTLGVSWLLVAAAVLYILSKNGALKNALR